MDLKLSGKKVFISGSTQGIGFAIAQQFLNENAEVVLNGRLRSKTEQAVLTLKEKFPNAKVSGIAADFTNSVEIELLLEKLKDIDILINNVGVFELKDFYDINDSDWQKIFELNVLSSVRLSRSLLPKMLERNWGRIVFISSESGVNVPENMIHYGMTKAAMMAVSNGLSKLTKGTEVTVNTVLAGPTYSDGVATSVRSIAESNKLTEEQMKNIIVQQTNSHSLLQRFINPSEVACFVTYLSSPIAIATNGSCLRADGGVLQSV